MKTFMPREQDVKKGWVLIDAEGKVLGRLATKIAMILSGKTKPIYTPHVITGDYVIVINAEKIRVTGKKDEQKKYIRHTGYPTGYREETYEKLLKEKPEEIIKKAVWGMVPHNKLGRQMLVNLKVYKGAEHPHKAQQPKALAL